MPTSIPNVESMLKLATERTQKSKEQLQKEISKFSKQFAIFVGSSERLMTYKYLVEVLGIKPQLATVAPEGTMSIKEVLETQAKTGINTEGYVMNSWEFLTKKGDKAYGFAVRDQSGQLEGRAFFDNEKELWNQVKPQFGDYIQLLNCTLNKFKETKTIRFGQTSGIKTLNEPPYPMAKLAMPINAVEKNGSSLLQAGLLTVNVRKSKDGEEGYIGCPICAKKLDVKEGQTATCQKCGDVLAERLYFIEALLSDGNDDLDLTFSPAIIKEKGKGFFQEGKYLYVFGEYYKDQFRVRSVKAVSDEEKVEGLGEEKLKERFTEKNLEETVNMIPKLIKTYPEGMEKTQLTESCKDLLDADEPTVEEATRICIANGAIKYDEKTKKFLTVPEQSKPEKPTPSKTKEEKKTQKPEKKGTIDIDKAFSGGKEKHYPSHPEG